VSATCAPSHAPLCTGCESHLYLLAMADGRKQATSSAHRHVSATGQRQIRIVG
jgi:hypothetical protein